MTGEGQEGSALVPAISILSLLGLLGSLSLLAGGAELLLATRLSRERLGFYAAESGLEETLDELAQGSGDLPEDAFFPPWPAVAVPIHRWTDGSWDLTRRIATLPDTGDADGDPGTPTVLFNRRFGYAGSPLATGGYPVFQLLVTATSGETRQAVVAEVAPVTCAPAIAAAWMSGGTLEVGGDLLVSGVAHTTAGEVVPGGAGQPAIASRGAVSIAAGAVLEGGGNGGAVALTDPQCPVPPDALAALGAGSTLARLEDLPPPPGSGALAGVVWSRGDFVGPLDGEGLLVVHNPDFDPLRYEASRLAIEEGVFTTDFDPRYSHLDAAHRPARLDLLLGGSFHGVIVADTVGACERPASLIGALITLSRSPQRVQAAAPLRILASPEAVRRAGRGPLRCLTAFKPLPATPERTE